MKFHRATLSNCADSTGTVVVIDVIRAFTTSAYAIASGAHQVFLVRSIEDAFNLKTRFPDSMMVGEVGGLPIPGFDFGNSPAQVMNSDLKGCDLIQRTSNGTQGVALSRNADVLLTSSFVCARATVRYIKQFPTEQITFVITGANTDQDIQAGPIFQGDEDAACADYLEALLLGKNPAEDRFLKRVRESPAGQIFRKSTNPAFASEDLELCCEINCFDFAMPVMNRNGLLMMKAV